MPSNRRTTPPRWAGLPLLVVTAACDPPVEAFSIRYLDVQFAEDRSVSVGACIREGEPVPDLTVTFGGLQMLSSGEQFGHDVYTYPVGPLGCTGRRNWRLDGAALVEADRGDVEVVFKVRGRDLRLTVRRPFVPRHLQPLAPIESIGPGRPFLLASEDGETVVKLLAELRGRPGTPVVKLSQVIRDDTVTLDIPVDASPGTYRLWVRATVSPVVACPVPTCVVTLPALFTKVVTLN